MQYASEPLRIAHQIEGVLYIYLDNCPKDISTATVWARKILDRYEYLEIHGDGRPDGDGNAKSISESVIWWSKFYRALCAEQKQLKLF